MTTPEPLLARARALQLHGVVSHWAECAQAPWVARSSSGRRPSAPDAHSSAGCAARIGRFKPLADFDWRWPEQCDQAAIAELMTLGFLETATNALLVGPSGLGKTTIAQNIAHQAVLRGTPCSSPPPASSWASSPRSTPTPRCAAACATTPAPRSW